MIYLGTWTLIIIGKVRRLIKLNIAPCLGKLKLIKLKLKFTKPKKINRKLT